MSFNIKEDNLKTDKCRKMTGKSGIAFKNNVYVISEASIVGKMEGEGPLAEYFDEIENDPLAGGSSWEDAESRFIFRCINKMLEKAALTPDKIRYLVGGDLMAQLMATSFAVKDLNIPLLGVYGACSTMAESSLIASLLIEGGFADKAIAVTSSHFEGAEKEFRFPNAYGNQRPLASTWTVTGSGGIILSSDKKVCAKNEKQVCITGVQPGKIVDYGIKDTMNMGAAMAPAACDTIYNHLNDFGREASYYDRIVTGDLGLIGSEIVKQLLLEKGVDISINHIDCGMEIYDIDSQDVHSGGSGCGCSAAVLCAYILKMMREGKWDRVLFVATGALLSPVSYHENMSVPGIAHGIVFETCN